MIEELIRDLPMLSSPQNQRVKDYVELRKDGNARRERQCFMLEGRHAVASALALPQAQFVDATELLQEVREVKSAEEIAVLQCSVDIIERAIEG